MGHCVSKNDEIYTACRTDQNPLQMPANERTASALSNKEATEKTMGDSKKESSDHLKITDWLIPRSRREPWKVYLNQDYWNELLKVKDGKKVDSDGNSNLLSFARGDFSLLPPESSKVFAIFVSSTFTDTEEERNLLIEDVQPYLRELCSMFGYEFRFCEMRWGVRDEASEDHQTVNLCLQELIRCQRESCGVNFITFLCDKYGYCPFPSIIPEEEFEELLSNIASDETIALLLKWFRKDENMLKSEYVLQKISSIIPEYNDEDNVKRKLARNEWWSEFEMMQKALKAAASTLNDAGRRKFYEISVTELEVLKGLIEADFPEKKGFMIDRRIERMEEKVDESGASKFIDIDWTSKKVNEESRKRLLMLKDEKVPKVLGDSQIKYYDIAWSENGVKKESHQEYLQNVTDSVCHVVFNSIKEHFTQMDQVSYAESNAENRLENELKQGAALMKKLADNAICREDITNIIKSYISEESCNGIDSFSPLIISGESGSGKSTIMATTILNLLSELQGDIDDIVVFRFIGTTPESGDTKHLLSSLLHQFQIVDDSTSESGDKYENAESLAKRFKHKIQTMKKNIFIFLDALDQISDVDIITEVEWLAASLPQNVKMVISCTPSKTNMPSIYFQYLKSIIHARNFISVEQLEAETCEKMFHHWLKKDERTLAPAQIELFETACERCPLPLFIKIAYDETKLWHSYSDVADHPLKSAINIEDLVGQLYDRLTLAHGKLLFEKGLAYLTIAKDGLSRQELEDVLSCDDDVLNDIFQWWIPPIRRIPQLQVVRLLSDLKDYLTETVSFSDGVPLLRWFHRQFKEATMAMMEKAVNRKEIHQHLANYFGGNWAEDGKPYIDAKENNKEVYADRKIPRNHLVIQGTLVKNKKSAEENMSFVVGSDCKINVRRLNEHCYHLIKGEMLEDAANTLCNLGYIHAKITENKLDDLREEFAMLFDALQTSESSNSTMSKVEEFNSFLLQRGHVMELFPSLTYQEAANCSFKSHLRECYEKLADKPAFILKNKNKNFDNSLISVIKGHSDSVISAAFQKLSELKQSNLLATGSLDGRVKLWFYVSGLEKGNFKAHSKSVNCIDFVDNCLLTISSDGKMILWDIECCSEKLVFAVNGNDDVIVPGNCCRYMNGLDWMVSGWDDGLIRIGDMKGNWITESEVHQYPVTCVHVINNEQIVAGYGNGEMIKCNIIESANQQPFRFAKTCDFGTEDQLVEVFDIRHHNAIFIVIGKQKSIRTQYSEDSNSAWAKNKFRNDPFVQNLVEEGLELTEAIKKKMDYDMSSIGSFLMLKNEDDSSIKCVLEGLPTPHEYVCADVRFPYLVTGGSNGSLRFWVINYAASSNELSVELLKEVGAHGLEVNRVEFAENGSHVVTVSDDMDVKLWKTISVEVDKIETSRVLETSYRITGCNTDKSGSCVVTWGKRGLVSSWREDSLLWTKICCSGEDIMSASVTPNGGKIMVGAKNYYELLDGDTGQTNDVKRSCVGRRVRICDFSEDGATALLGDNCDVRLVLIEPQMEPIGFNDVTWKAHDSHVNCGQFCSNLYHIATGSADGSIKMWNNSYQCALVVEIGFPVFALQYVTSVNKLACILEGDGMLNVQVSCQHPSLDDNASLENSNATSEKADTAEIKDLSPTTENCVKTFEHTANSTSQEELVQVGTETWCLPTVQNDPNAKDDFLLPMANDLPESSDFPPGGPPGGFDLPPMSEEMLKNLEKLQAMFMSPPDFNEMPPFDVPTHQPGPHRLLKKERREVQYVERKEVAKTTIALFDVGADDTGRNRVEFKQKIQGLNSCVLAKDSKTLYSSSSDGKVYVWRNIDDKWYDVGRYVNEDETFVSDLCGTNDDIFVASKYRVQRLCVASN